jgi:protein SCO1/2
MFGSPKKAIIVGLAMLLAPSQVTAMDKDEPSPYDPQAAVKYSQAAVGNRLSHHQLINRSGKPITLDHFDGAPLIVNMIYTACADFCPTVVENLRAAVDAGKEIIGDNRFNIVSVGFDPRGDTPARMRAFATTHGIHEDNWYFLSADEETLKKLAAELGFIYFPSFNGFDHIAQTSVIDLEGRVFQQVYGVNFDPPAVIEPLKQLLSGQSAASSSLSDVVERIKLFCTFYDPTAGRYELDYSIVISLVIGGIILLILMFIVSRAGLHILQERRRRTNRKDENVLQQRL